MRMKNCAFNRNEFLRPLDRFYKAIEVSAENTTGISEKQAFLNKVYERFFQGYSPKEADTHGIVYTPREHHRLGPRTIPRTLPRPLHHQGGYLPIHLRRSAPPRLQRTLRRQPPPRTAAHSVRLFRAFLLLLCHPERSRIVQRTIPRSRGTPRLPTPSSGLERSSLHEVRPAAFVVRTPLYAGWQLTQTRGLSTPSMDSRASPFTTLKMTRQRETISMCFVLS